MFPRVRWFGWLALLLPVAIWLCVPAVWPRWLFMWLLTGSIYFAFKLLTLSAADTTSVPSWRKWAYVFACLGLDARRFLHCAEAVPPPRAVEWLEGTLNMAAGAALFWGAQYWIGDKSPILLGWAGMVGTIWMLHFGSFHLVSCFWRSFGMDAPRLMQHPTRSTSVSQFWGRWWNTAFRDVTHQFLFRPLATQWGATAALVVGFLVSGLLHEIVISLPAGGGYGGPTAFFCIQAAAMLLERSTLGRAIGLGRGWRGWLFAGLVLLLPARLLFADPFVLRIAVPFMQALGAA
jgi:alginate O-acetyltransferase complex protein AlgI